MPPGALPRGMRPGQSSAAMQMRGNMMGNAQTPEGLKRGADGKSNRSSKG